MNDDIDLLKTWCLANYGQGADVMVECWDAQQFQDLLDRSEGSVERALDTLRALAGVYQERQAGTTTDV